jgi:rhamnulokinase
MGALSPQVVTTDHAFASRIVNELTVDSLFLARNIMGLWLLQQSRASWQRQGSAYGYGELVDLARQAPEGGPVVFPDDLSFLAPDDMPEAIAAYCRRTGQTPPDGVPATARCVLESLALSYRQALEQLSTALGRKLNVVHIVGGGSQNGLLCQFTADATGLPVVAGPVEATVAGNVMVQALALGDVSSTAEIRQVVRRSSELVEYQPSGSAYWDGRYETYKKNLQKT